MALRLFSEVSRGCGGAGGGKNSPKWVQLPPSLPHLSGQNVTWWKEVCCFLKKSLKITQFRFLLNKGQWAARCVASKPQHGFSPLYSHPLFYPSSFLFVSYPALTAFSASSPFLPLLYRNKTVVQYLIALVSSVDDFIYSIKTYLWRRLELDLVPVCPQQLRAQKTPECMEASQQRPRAVVGARAGRGQVSEEATARVPESDRPGP